MKQTVVYSLRQASLLALLIGLYVWYSPVHSQELTSDFYPEPANVGGAKISQGVTHLGLNLTLDRGLGVAEFEFDHTQYDFNEFGDPRPRGNVMRDKLKVILNGPLPPEPGIAPQPNNVDVYEIKELAGQGRGVRLTLRKSPAGNIEVIRLVTYRRGGAVHFVSFHPVASPVVDASAVSIQFDGQTSLLFVPEGWKNIRIEGDWQTEGKLHLDPNHMTWSESGTQVISTAVGWKPRTVKMRPQEIEDPQGRGRKLVEITTTGPRPTQYFLVIDPTDGEHRLIITKEGKPVHVLRLNARIP